MGISPGRAEFTIRYFIHQKPTTTTFVVDEVSISHRTWTNGKGSTDILQIRGPAYRSHTVAALDYDLVHNRIRIPERGLDVSPKLDDPAATGGIPEEHSDPALIAPLAPTIVALSGVIGTTTRRPVSTHLEFIS